MHRLSYSHDPESFTFSTQCSNCIVPLVIRGHSSVENGIYTIEQCGCNFDSPLITSYDTAPEMVAAFEARVSGLIAEVTAEATAFAESFVAPNPEDPDAATVAWNDQRPDRKLVNALLEMSRDDMVGGQVVTADELVKHYDRNLLVRVVRSRAVLARGTSAPNRQANTAMATALGSVASKDKSEDVVLTDDQMSAQYSSLELAQMICDNAAAARAAARDAVIVLEGRR